MQKTSKGATMKEPKRKKCLTIVKYSPSTVRWRAEVVSIETHPEYPLAFHNVKVGKGETHAAFETVLINNIHDGQHESEGQVKFITEAWAQIIDCGMLKWTYAYGYYLHEDEHRKEALFEYLQGEAEFWLERLHECAENGLKRFLDAKEPEDYREFRTKLTDPTRVTKHYFANWSESFENGMTLGDVDG
ncbi:hypothetical protein IFM89_017651 [Coptis chinensis]|uniref:Uncharacterized protein n=1 Tax=Coptis chinensis TaxID=261450 RepID=A0A835GZW1_9MAGN|nr:hypothetical protein IFM89_017651 [Coptis chinensis]